MQITSIIAGQKTGIKNSVFFLFKEQLETFASSRLQDEFAHLANLLKAHNFNADVDELLVLPRTMANGEVEQFFFLGLGSKNEPDNAQLLENIRRAICFMIARAKKLKLAELQLDFIEQQPFTKLSWHDFSSQVTSMLLLANYSFNDLKKQHAAEVVWQPKIMLAVPAALAQEAAHGIEQGVIIGNATNWARKLADLPPNIATPPYVAEQAKNMALEQKLQIKVFGPEQARAMSMGGFLAVQAGSEFDGQFIEVQYRAATANAKTIALVGKGVTFDTGGVSLKPANSMKGMKYDMCGAAAVLAVMQVVAQLKPNINVVALAPMVENMPGGGSYRQDDIVVHYNGLSTEIENTDAEGRLILADALAYAVDKHNPDYIIDIATLTGACVVALGHFYSGLMTNNQELADKLIKSGAKTGDWLWQMPMHSYYKKAIKSPVADLANAGGSAYGGGAITAAKFLEAFVAGKAWAHIDIAGTENAIPDSAYASKLSSGVGVRLLVEFVLNESL